MKVFVSIYEHKHGSDVVVYATQELAAAARIEIAETWWEYELGKRPRPESASALADEYFEYMAEQGTGEWFAIHECEVVGG